MTGQYIRFSIESDPIELHDRDLLSPVTDTAPIVSVTPVTECHAACDDDIVEGQAPDRADAICYDDRPDWRRPSRQAPTYTFGGSSFGWPGRWILSL